MENVIFTRGDYVDLLVIGQVIGIGRVESTKTKKYNGRERVNVAMLWFM
jgi:hypothetical protein